MAEAATFQDATRDLSGFTASAEKRLLLGLAGRMPAWLNSDHLTALGLAAMLGAGLAYAASRFWPWALLAVNVFLVVNWFGDSLDGTLARVRNRCRPRYGFYVDHIVDTFGALFLLAGLALSGFMDVWLAVSILIAYFMLQIGIYLATYSLGVFKIAYGGMGGTELRLLLGFGNLLLLVWPRISVLGVELRLYDVAGSVALAGLVVTLLVSTWQNARRLYALERL